MCLSTDDPANISGYDDQGLLIDAEESDLSPEDYEKNLSHLRKVARDDGLDRIFKEYGVDVIVGSSDTAIKAFASGSGRFTPGFMGNTYNIRIPRWQCSPRIPRLQWKTFRTRSSRSQEPGSQDFEVHERMGGYFWSKKSSANASVIVG